MSASEMEKLRHAEERGKILQALQQEYGRAMTSVRSLVGAMDLLGFSMSGSNMQFSLQYLSDRGYVQIWRARELPSWRTDRANENNGEAILFAKLLPLGLQLIDGLTAASVGVRF